MNGFSVGMILCRSLSLSIIPGLTSASEVSTYGSQTEISELPEFQSANDLEWLNFKTIFNKVYTTVEEESLRRYSYEMNKMDISNHNERYRSGEESFDVGINHLTDLSNEQYKKLNGYQIGDRRKQNNTVFLQPHNAQLPSSIDWRMKNCVTPVKDQGNCGSCWSFSATGSLECQHMRKTGNLVSLSEQNLIDCSTSFGNNGCDGGLMDNAFDYINKNHGIDTEESYPYEGVQSQCRFKGESVGANDFGRYEIPVGDEESLKYAVATVGPISVAIDASHVSFQFYKTGVYDNKNCSSKSLDHGVLVVGYGTDAIQGDYWIIKNSWGEKWGWNGYILMVRNRDNQCGVATAASYPIV